MHDPESMQPIGIMQVYHSSAAVDGHASITAPVRCQRAEAHCDPCWPWHCQQFGHFSSRTCLGCWVERHILAVAVSSYDFLAVFWKNCSWKLTSLMTATASTVSCICSSEYSLTSDFNSLFIVKSFSLLICLLTISLCQVRLVSKCRQVCLLGCTVDWCFVGFSISSHVMFW